MKKIKILAMAALVALGLTACSNADNSYRERYFIYEQTQYLPSAAGTYIVTVNNTHGTAEVGAVESDWMTIAAKETPDYEKSQIAVTVTENTTGANRTASVVTIKSEPNTVYLTIIQGITNIDNPNEEETDQPAYTPGL
jgi:hypothetical protein